MVLNLKFVINRKCKTCIYFEMEKDLGPRDKLSMRHMYMSTFDLVSQSFGVLIFSSALLCQ